MRAPSQIFACPNLSILSTQRPPHPDGTGCSLAFPSGGSVLAVLGKLCSQPLQCHSSWPARLDAGPLCPHSEPHLFAPVPPPLLATQDFQPSLFLCQVCFKPQGLTSTHSAPQQGQVASATAWQRARWGPLTHRCPPCYSKERGPRPFWRNTSSLLSWDPPPMAVSHSSCNLAIPVGPWFP